MNNEFTTNKFVYLVHYGQAPYKEKIFTRYSDVSKFIKEQIDAGYIIRSVCKERRVD